MSTRTEKEAARQRLITEIRLECALISNRRIKEYRHQMAAYHAEMAAYTSAYTSAFNHIKGLPLPQHPAFPGVLTPPADLDTYKLRDLIDMAHWLHIEAGEAELVIEDNGEVFAVDIQSAVAGHCIALAVMGRNVARYLRNLLAEQAINGLLCEV